MPRHRDQVDMLNASIRRATELTLLGLRKFMEDNPNPIGQIGATGRSPLPRLTQAELNRLLGKRR